MKFRGLKCIHYGGPQRRSESRHPPRKEAWVPLNSLLRPTHLFIHITPQNLHLYIYSHAFFLFFYPTFLYLPRTFATLFFKHILGSVRTFVTFFFNHSYNFLYIMFLYLPRVKMERVYFYKI